MVLGSLRQTYFFKITLPASGAGEITMVILVRCPDGTVSLALASRLELLVSEGLITAHLTPEGWVAAKSRKPAAGRQVAATRKSRCTAFVSCF